MGQRQAYLKPGQEASERFQYLPLAARTIRLIHLHRTKKGELCCSIQHVSLDEPVKYVALSYAWGEGEASSQINVRNKNKEVVGFLSLTANLHAAINDLWNAAGLRPKVFWIDQIAINQDDLAERASQVSLMAEIFRKASIVVTYLGPGTKADAAALKLMKRVEACYQKQFDSKIKGSDDDRLVLQALSELRGESSDTNSYRHLIQHNTLGRNLLRELQTPLVDPDSPGWQCAIEISSPSCSQRLWMVQENALNKNTCMLRGTTLVEWELIAAFASLIDILPSFVLALLHMSPEQASQSNMFGLWGLRTIKHPGNLMQLMWVLQTYSCSDPRDRVYACMGIAGDGEALKIVPDYAKAIEDVYTEVACQTLKYHQNLDILDFVVEPDLLSPQPSWAPQRCGSLSEGLVHRVDFRRSDDWRASGDQYGAIRCEGGILIADGVVLDTISPLQIKIRIRDRVNYNMLFNIMDLDYRRSLQARTHDTENLKHEYIRMVQSQVSHVQQHQDDMDEMMSWSTLRGIDNDYAAVAIYCTMAVIKTYPSEASAQKGIEIIKRSFAWNKAQLKALSRTEVEHDDLFGAHRKPFIISPPDYNNEEEWLESQVIENSSATAERTIFCTENGRFGSICTTVKAGDQVAVLKGGRAVYVLRLVEDEYRFVGSGYVYGLMDGEACLDPMFEENVRPIRIK